MQNGFFHERPSDYDIYVAENMRAEVGAAVINWHVTKGSEKYNDQWEYRAEVEWNGKTYIAVSRGVIHNRYWQIEDVKA